MEDMETRIERIPLPVPPRLVITTRDGSREVALGTTELTLGRGEDNTIVVAADAVSRHHASLQPCEDGVLIKDLGSTNGIAVDGQLLPEVVLRTGMAVTIGTSVTLTYLPSRNRSPRRCGSGRRRRRGAGASPAAEREAEAGAEAEDRRRGAAIEAEVVVDEAPAAEAEVVVEGRRRRRRSSPRQRRSRRRSSCAEAEVVVAEEPAAEAGSSSKRRRSSPAPELVTARGGARRRGGGAPQGRTALRLEVVVEEARAEAAPETGDAEAETLLDEAPPDEDAAGRRRGAGRHSPDELVRGSKPGPAGVAGRSLHAGGAGRAGCRREPDRERVRLVRVLAGVGAGEPGAGAAAAARERSRPRGDGRATGRGRARRRRRDTVPSLLPTEPGIEEPEAAPAGEDLAQGWYLWHSEGGSGRQDGPCTRDELVALGQNGGISAGDLIWHESFVDWVAAEHVPAVSQYVQP